MLNRLFLPGPDQKIFAFKNIFAMPTPLEVLLDPISLYILAMYLGLILWEAFFPARKLPKVSFWQLKGINCFLFIFFPLYLSSISLCEMVAWFTVD
jgi:hypothetical protein